MAPTDRDGADATDERALLARAQRGDEDAFAQIVAAHADQVYGALRRFGLSPGDADEVAQEVFVRAWRSLDRFQGRSRLSTWLYRIAFNEAQRRLSRTRTDHVGEEALGVLAAPLGERPDARLAGRELEEMVRRALAGLPADLRAAVVLRDLEGLSSAEAAEVAGVREAAFKSRLHRGRMRLRALLEPYLAPDQ